MKSGGLERTWGTTGGGMGSSAMGNEKETQGDGEDEGDKEGCAGSAGLREESEG